MAKSARQQQRTLIAAAADAGKTLQDFLSTRMAMSRRGAKSLIDTRSVWVNRKRVWMANHLLRAGDQVVAPVYDDTVAQVKVVKLRVLVEDGDFLVADKPAGMVASGTGGVDELLRAQLGEPLLQVVHRLDRDTTGCLLFARRPEAFNAAVGEFKKRHVRKAYNAIVAGRFEQTVSTVHEDIDGARAVTNIRLLQATEDASFLGLRIETGRTHQIRKHLAALRHPVLGDREYGMKFARDARLIDIPRQMLHAVELEMPHPLKPGTTLRAHSPLPADFRRCLKLFKL